MAPMGLTKGDRVAVLTSGGDAPGMNAAVRAAARVGAEIGLDMVGVEDGYAGLIEGRVIPLDIRVMDEAARRGGTALGTARSKAFATPEGQKRARETIATHNLRGLLVIGGNGSLTGARTLTDVVNAASGAKLIVGGVPASIDNDLACTSMAIGVDTAMNTIVEACDRIFDTATAHKRTFIVEVMGRDCGYLAMTSAIAVGADLALFPESGKPEQAIVDQVVKTVLTVRARARKSRRVIIIKAEGVAITTDKLKAEVDKRLRDNSPDADPSGIETRVTVLGHVVRGGRPSAFDRLLGSRLGNVAVRALIGGDTLKMTAWMPPTEVPEDVGRPSEADPKCWLVDLGAVLVETDNLLKGRSPLTRWRAGAFEEIEGALLM